MKSNPKVKERPAAEAIFGWEERFVGQEPKIGEIAELYRSIGFETRIEPYTPGDCGECNECFTDNDNPFLVVYTRPGNPGEPEVNSEMYG